MQSDMNQVILCGPSTWCKEWDFGNNTWSTFCFRMDIGDRQSVFIDVPLDLKTIEKSSYKALKHSIESKSGQYIMLNGILTEKPDPKDKTKTRLAVKANLSSIGILTGVPIPMNRVNVSGVTHVTETTTPGLYNVATSYRNVKDNSYKSRMIPIIGGSSGTPKHYDKALITGRLVSKLPNGTEFIHVQAESMFSFGPLHSGGYQKKTTVEAPDTHGFA